MRSFLLTVLALLGVVCAQFGEMLSPRFYLGSSGVIERRDGSCLVNSHSCLDTNSTACCSDDLYCVVNTNFTAGCCAIGSECGLPCPSASYVCPTTITVSGTASVSTACCERSCPSTSQYKCAAALGGGCCSFGYDCTSGAGGNSCISTVSSTTLGVGTAIPIPSGCTTNQYACATGLGGGCCDNGQLCTVLDNTNYCALAAGSALETRTGANGIIATEVPAGSSGKGLSTGAKAGIGAGVALGVLAIIGALLFFCTVHRRRANENQRASRVGSAAMAQDAGSDVPNGSKAGSKRPSARRLHSQPSDYFGPAAVSGPFTQRGTGNSAGTSPGYGRGVAAVPQSPGDIVSPVEIDSRDHSNVTSPGAFSHYSKKQEMECVVELP